MQTLLYIGLIIGAILFIGGMMILPKIRRYLHKGQIVTTGDGPSKRGDIGLIITLAGLLLLILCAVIGNATNLF